MAFHFNPSLWFLCKLCREAFPDTEKLKAHKLESHLGESLNIKCIVFEEKPLSHEWIPSSQELSSKPYQLINTNEAPSQESNDDLTNVKAQVTLQSQQNSRFKNPYVSLKVLTPQELNSGIKNINGGKSTLGSIHSLEFKGEKRGLLTKRKQNSVVETIPHPSKLPKTEDKDKDDAHKNKIRELLSNAVIIKSEPSNDSDDQVFLKPPDLPISIVSTYSLPSSSDSKIINSVNKIFSFNSLQQQQKHSFIVQQGNSEGFDQFQLQEHPPSFVQSSLTTFDVANTDSPFIPQILPTSVMQPEQSYSYPIILNSNRKPIQVQGDAGSDNLNELNATLPAEPGITSMTNAFTGTGKEEFIENDSVANQDVKIGSTQISHVNASFPLKSQSTFVRRVSDKTKQKRYFCQICSASFSRNWHLTQHKLTHSNYRPFQCPTPKCNSKFKTKSTLRGHLIAIHGHVSDFRCPVCDKYFPSKKELMCHEPAHSRDRPHLCDFPNCGAQFKSRKNLHVHTRTQHGKHLGLEQFECPTCGDTFGLRKCLNVHQRKAHQTADVQILP